MTPPTPPPVSLPTSRRSNSPRPPSASTTPETPHSTGLYQPNAPFAQQPPPYVTTPARGTQGYVPSPRGYTPPPRSQGYIMNPYAPPSGPFHYPRQAYTPTSPGQPTVPPGGPVGAHGQIPVSVVQPFVPVDPPISVVSPVNNDSTSNEQRWHCSECTFLNHESLQTCEICEMPRVKSSS